MSKINSITQYQNKNLITNQQSQRSSLLSQINSNNLLKTPQITNIIECPICDQSIRQAHMCPSCCKLFCQTCIKNWIRNKKQECPNANCMKPLTNHNLLNCSVLGRQIEQALSKSVNKIKTPLTSSVVLSPSGSKILYPKLNTSGYESVSSVKNSEVLCQKHQLKLDYFCEQCYVALCSDCAVLSNNHQGHKLCKYSQKKIKFREYIDKIKKDISSAKAKLEAGRQEQVAILERVKVLQIQKLKSLSEYLNIIYIKNIQNNDQKFKMAQQYLVTHSQTLTELTNRQAQLQEQVGQKKPSILGQKYYSQTIVELQNYLASSTQQPQQEKILNQRLENHLVPGFEQKVYILDNYHQLRKIGEILISQPLFSKGTEWRLKIFPGGINPTHSNLGLEEYLAIHLQMTKGHQHSNWYRYRIQLVNQANRAKCMSFQFENSFHQGSQWCLDNFIKISSLYTENYIHPINGYIQLVLYIRCLSYYHAIADQQFFIKQKQNQISQNHMTIINLRKMANQLGIKVETATGLGSSRRNSQSKRVIAIDER